MTAGLNFLSSTSAGVFPQIFFLITFKNAVEKNVVSKHNSWLLTDFEITFQGPNNVILLNEEFSSKFKIIDFGGKEVICLNIYSTYS